MLINRNTPLSIYDSPQWYAVYVVTRHEKIIAQQFARRSIEAFLPVYRGVHIWNRRKAEVQLPLFPSYIFVHICFRDRVRVLEVPGVVHIVSFNGIPASVPAEQIDGLRAAMQLRNTEPHSYISSGTQVEIKSGPLAGLRGVVVRQNSVIKIVVSVDFICRSVSVELNPSDLECVQPLNTLSKGTADRGEICIDGASDQVPGSRFPFAG